MFFFERNLKSNFWALFIRPKIPEIPGCGANETGIFRNFGCTSRGWPKIPENSVPFDHSCSGLVSPSLEIKIQHG